MPQVAADLVTKLATPDGLTPSTIPCRGVFHLSTHEFSVSKAQHTSRPSTWLSTHLGCMI